MLTIEEILVKYGQASALKKVSLSLGEHQAVALIGPNGSGKTTLLRAISGLHPIASGVVVFDGEDITNRAPHVIVKAGIAHVAQGRELFGPLTVEENLDLGGTTRATKERSERRDLAFYIFPRLAERRAQRASSLSGGEQQMLAIGRALMSKPRLLLLDEPSLGLAPKLIDDVYEAINRLRGEIDSVLLVEQSPQLALEVTDYTYVIQVGEIVAEDSSRAMAKRDVGRLYLGGASDSD